MTTIELITSLFLTPTLPDGGLNGLSIIFYCCLIMGGICAIVEKGR